MPDHGPAQLDLIRRYSRTLREIQSDAARAQRITRARPAGANPREPLLDSAKAMAHDARTALSRDASQPRAPAV